MTTGILIQARTGSSRYPGKIYEDLNGKFTLQRVLESAMHSQIANKIILLMPKYDEKEFWERTLRGDFKDCTDDRFEVFFGSEDNVLSRYFFAARKFSVQTVVRLTADCPFGGAKVDEMLMEYLKNRYNGFMGNNDLISPTPYPCGVDVEIFPYWMLADAMENARDPAQLEHVTPYFYRQGSGYDIHPFLNLRPNEQMTCKFGDFSFDTAEDYRLLLKITKHFDELETKYPDWTKSRVLDAALKLTD